ncbi:unnamed protein product [Phytophthora fragariaefolia]|uniref:Unnamed protein product n=1 Tax=Phytophthora fragariaefolia TaxID=1490495 RepID=A0A9W6WU44_9STRA|nr:unnamed protein product [Phytophthora fragariaefolia]
MIVAGDTESIAAVATSTSDPASDARTRPKGAEPRNARQARYAAQSLAALEAAGNPVAPLVREFMEIFPDKVPAVLPPDRGVRHEIDLVPGAKYCVTRQWPLPRDQVEAIDAFFESRRQAGHVRESLSPHSSPTFCVKKATGRWTIVHAFNKLNEATIPAQTPIPRKDMVQDTMSGSTKYSAVDLMDGFYQILMREDDAPLTAVSTPSGMLWEWLVMPQGVKNALATFNRMVPNLLRPYRDFAPSYFDDIFIHSRAEDGMTDVEVHLQHLRKVFEVMKENKLYANLKQCIFCAPEIPELGSYVSKDGVRADPEKIEAICAWPTPQDQKQLRQWLGLATYLHHYSKNFASTIHPLSQLLKADATWSWRPELQAAFGAVKSSLSTAPSGRHAVGDEDDDECAVCTAEDVAAVEVAATSPLRDLIVDAYKEDASCLELIQFLRDPGAVAKRKLSPRSRSRVDRYSLDGELLTYRVDREDPRASSFLWTTISELG